MPPKVIKHFKTKDPILYQVIAQNGDILKLNKREPDQYFLSLIDEIISQQLSGKVADVIFTRFKGLFKEQIITPETVLNIKDEQVIAHLTQVKGIGKWTAEMFLIFTLGRENVFSHGDLGLKTAIKRIYSLENPTLEQVEGITQKWQPYRTYACRILWTSLNNK